MLKFDSNEYVIPCMLELENQIGTYMLMDTNFSTSYVPKISTDNVFFEEIHFVKNQLVGKSLKIAITCKESDSFPH